MNYNKKNDFFNNNNNNYDMFTNNNSLLISKKIDTYFNDLIKIPEPIQQTSGGSFSKFYDDYIEHNLLLLFIIFCLCIFLLIKYINKNSLDTFEEIIYTDSFTINNQKSNNNNFINDTNKKNDTDIDTETNTDTNTDTNTNTDTDTDTNINTKYKRNNIKKKYKYNKYKELLKEQQRRKYLLQLEKQSILDIIDELSNINQQNIIKNMKPNVTKHTNNDYLNNDYLNNDYINNTNYTLEPIKNNESSLNINGTHNYPHYSLINSELNNDNTSTFYNINKNINYKDKKNPNYIKGIYIESPYEE
jgi:hypothetical protein